MPEEQKADDAAVAPSIKIQLPTNFFQRATISRILGSLISSAGIIGIMGSVLYGGAQLYADEYINTIIKEKKIIRAGDILGVTSNVDKLFDQQKSIIEQQQEFETLLNDMQQNDAVDRSILRSLENEQKDVGDDIKELNRDIKQLLRTFQRGGANADNGPN